MKKINTNLIIAGVVVLFAILLVGQVSANGNTNKDWATPIEGQWSQCVVTGTPTCAQTTGEQTQTVTCVQKDGSNVSCNLGTWVPTTYIDDQSTNPTFSCPTNYHYQNNGNWDQRCHRDIGVSGGSEHKTPTGVSCPSGYDKTGHDEDTQCKKVNVAGHYINAETKVVTRPCTLSTPDYRVCTPAQSCPTECGYAGSNNSIPNGQGGYLTCLATKVCEQVPSVCNANISKTVVSKVEDPVLVEPENIAGSAVKTLKSPLWANISDAIWIWSEAQVSDPTIDHTNVFTKTFDVTGVVTGANLEIATDNGYIVKINGGEVVNKIDQENSYSSTAMYDVKSYLKTGSNTLEITVKNFALANSTYDTNPAGLLYKLNINSDDCPPTGTIKITKYECPADTVITRSANGPSETSIDVSNYTVPAGCMLQDGAKFGYTYDAGNSINNTPPFLGLFGDNTQFVPFTPTSNGITTLDKAPTPGRYIIAELDSEGKQLPAQDMLGLYCYGDGDTSATNDNQEVTFSVAGKVSNCVAYNKATQLSTPTLLGWNVQSEATGLESNPISLACQANGLTIGASRNSLNQRWTSVPGSDIKYIRRVSNDGGKNWNILSNMVFTTPSMNSWFSFGAGEEGTYDTEVMAFNDINHNNIADDGLFNISNWSNDCKITYDATSPAVPTHISPVDNIVIKTADLTMIDWSDVTDPSSPVVYYYEVSNSPTLNSDKSFASPIYQSGILSDSSIPTLGTPDGIYYWHVRAVDNAGNSSIWSNAWKVTVDNTVPALKGSLSAQDFAVVNYDVGEGLGILKGYTAGFGLTDATLEGATSVVVQLFAGNTLLQTDTAIIPKFNADIKGTQFSSPFDVSGTFAYGTDGYWTNHHESEFGQSIPATKVVATVILANGKVVTAENTNLTGNPESIYPQANIENHLNSLLTNDNGHPTNGAPAGLMGFVQGNGRVLGVSTERQVIGDTCGLYMEKFIRMGSSKNDSEQVKKLQEFLNKQLNSNIPITGFFGPLTLAKVKEFQIKYSGEVLKPWGLNLPTGLVYLSTIRQINNLECPNLMAELPELVPWSANL